MSRYRRARSISRAKGRGRRGAPLDPAHLAALFSYGAQWIGWDTDDDLVLAEHDTPHAANPKNGCGACDLFAHLLTCWLDPDRNVGNPDTWAVANVSAAHVSGWLDHWGISATAQTLAAVETALNTDP